MTSAAAEALGPGGAVSQALDQFRFRASQQRMAAAVEQTLASRGTLICEAGTGTGKTFAYLVPVLLAGKRVLISTGTKHLQDQLFGRDLPLVRAALGRPVRVALLKGRANYLCHYRLALSADRPMDRVTSRAYVRVSQWARRTRIGDIAELTELPEDAPVWPLVTSTAENCLGGQCPSYDECFVVKSRRRALDADVVVVNHHLLFADLALREEGFGELLPDAEAVVVDEAHSIAQVASQFFGQSVSSRQLANLLDDARQVVQAELPDTDGFGALAQVLADALADVRAKFGRDGGRRGWTEARRRPGVAEASAALMEALDRFARGLEVLAERSDPLAHVAERARGAHQRLGAILDSEDGSQVVWLEVFRRSLSWHATPLEVGRLLREHLQSAARAWVFTSATLSVSGSCAHFAERLGLEAWDELCLPSPFDFERQWLGYLPRSMPQPRDGSYHEHLAQAVLPVLEASQGRAFLLFTSYRGLHLVYERLANALPYPLLRQGDAPRHELLNRFRELGNAVLFGTSSFWQGVDVPGTALSCVIIDKLPFEAPGDPVLAARLAYLREQGEDPFVTHQIPQAVIALKQGVGRLIRDEEDRGVVMLGDPRIVQQRYGRTFLESLPPLPLTRSLEDVRTFFSPAPHAGGLGMGNEAVVDQSP